MHPNEHVGTPDPENFLRGLAALGTAIANSEPVRDARRVRGMKSSPLRDEILYRMPWREAHRLARRTLVQQQPRHAPRVRRPSCGRPRSRTHRTPRATRGPPSEDEGEHPHVALALDLEGRCA